MNHSVYSFSDVSMVLSHPSVGKITITGEGADSISISRANDQSQHDIAADGSVMTSKIVTKNGTVSIVLQQTSAAHKWLKKWHAYLMAAPTAEWAQTSAVLTLPSFGETITMTGISPQKRPDAAFQSAGQKVTWNVLAAFIEG